MSLIACHRAVDEKLRSTERLCSFLRGTFIMASVEDLWDTKLHVCCALFRAKQWCGICPRLLTWSHDQLSLQW